MKTVVAHVLPAVVLASLWLVLASAGALAKDDPGNHYGRFGNPGNHYGEISNPGHHYGQLKHPKTPPPVPTPSPNPNPNPTPQPVTHPGSGGGSTVYVSTGGSQPGVTSGGDTSKIPVTVTLPTQDQATIAPPVATPDGGLDWLLLLILPALLAIWVIAAAGLGRNAARRIRVARTAVPAPNPA